MATKIKDTDKGWKKAIKRLKKVSVTSVGVQGQVAAQPHPDGGATNIQIATWHEFGMGNNPRRSWLRDFVDVTRPKIDKKRGQLARRILDGKMDTKQAGDALGEFISKGMQVNINKGIKPDTTPASIARRVSGRQSPNSLVDTTAFRQSIIHTVVVVSKRQARLAFK